jgi:hypothetical protein
MTEHTPPEAGRWVGMGEVLVRVAIAAVGAAVVVGAVGAIIALASGRDASYGVAIAYYIIGCILVLIALVPTGGYSVLRGTMTRRRPTGARQEPILLVIGVLLFGLGFLFDVTRPF